MVEFTQGGAESLEDPAARGWSPADYRAHFWRLAVPLLRQGRIEDVIRVGLVAHHLITFARDAAIGKENASFYSSKPRRHGAETASIPEPVRSAA
jgi:hypothetical protein